MADGSDGQKSEMPIVAPSAMLSPPLIHAAEADVQEFQTMSSAFDYSRSLEAPENGSVASGASNVTSGRASLENAGAASHLLKGAWPFFLSALPALVTLIALSLRLFPWLEPSAPPEVRSVTITDVVFGERNRDLGDGVVANAVYFEVEAVGYNAEDAADDIAVDWLVFDAQTRQRLEEQMMPERWGVIVFGTRSDRVVGEIVIPPPANHAGCVFVRVQLQPLAIAAAAESSGAGLMLDIADSTPFDPFDPANPDCPDEPMPASASA